MPNDHDHSVASLPSDKRNVIDASLREICTPATVVPGTRGRLLFALDATASRQPTWDRPAGCRPTCFGRRRRSAGSTSSSSITAVVTNAGPRSGCRSPSGLPQLMERIDCRSGVDPDRQGHCPCQAGDSERLKVQALVFVGDAMEEKLDDLCHAAGELGGARFYVPRGR